MYAPGSFRHTLKKILKAIRAEHIRFHDLHHTFAAASLEHGMDVKTLSTITGYVSSAITLSIYAHSEEGCERLLAKMIPEMKAEITAERRRYCSALSVTVWGKCRSGPGPLKI